MRKIKDLLKKEECIWLYLDSEEECREFFKDAEEEHFSFGDLPPEQWVTGSIIAVHSNGKMGHMPYFITKSLFFSKYQGRYPRIVYRKYKDGERNYICNPFYFLNRMFWHC